MPVHVDHFDLTGRNAVVLNTDTPAGSAIATAWEEAGAKVIRLGTLLPIDITSAVQRAVEDLGSLHLLTCAPDTFLAKSVTATTPDDVATVMQANFTTQFTACQAAIDVMLPQGTGGNIVLVTHVLGQRGLPNTSAYASAHGAVHNLIRALAQEVAPHGIVVNGIALGWMGWMSDRLDPDNIDAQRAIRFTITKRSGTLEDVGPLATWLAGTGVGFVTGQIFPVDGGLTQHL